MTYQIVEILSDGARRPVANSRRDSLDDARFGADLLHLIYGGTYTVVEVSSVADLAH